MPMVLFTLSLVSSTALASTATPAGDPGLATPSNIFVPLGLDATECAGSFDRGCLNGDLGASIANAARREYIATFACEWPAGETLDGCLNLMVEGASSEQPEIYQVFDAACIVGPTRMGDDAFCFGGFESPSRKVYEGQSATGTDTVQYVYGLDVRRNHAWGRAATFYETHTYAYLVGSTAYDWLIEVYDADHLFVASTEGGWTLSNNEHLAMIDLDGDGEATCTETVDFLYEMMGDGLQMMSDAAKDTRVSFSHDITQSIGGEMGGLEGSMGTQSGVTFEGPNFGMLGLAFTIDVGQAFLQGNKAAAMADACGQEATDNYLYLPLIVFAAAPVAGGQEGHGGQPRLGIDVGCAMQKNHEPKVVGCWLKWVEPDAGSVTVEVSGTLTLAGVPDHEPQDITLRGLVRDDSGILCVVESYVDARNLRRDGELVRRDLWAPQTQDPRSWSSRLAHRDARMG